MDEVKILHAFKTWKPKTTSGVEAIVLVSVIWKVILWTHPPLTRCWLVVG